MPSTLAPSPAFIPALFDPWIGTPQQTSRRVAQCQILLGDLDVTSRLDPHLISVHVIDAGGVSYSCDIELDDRDGRLPLPPLGLPVTVNLGWLDVPTQPAQTRTSEGLYTVYSGQVSSIEHGFGRKEGGRRLWVHCTGMGALSGTNMRTPMQEHMGEGAPPGMAAGTPVPFLDMANQVAKLGGGFTEIDPGLGAKARDYWSMDNESPMHWMQSMATELGGWMRIEGGNKIVVVDPTNISSRPTVKAEWNDNLIGWRVYPIEMRSTWDGAAQQYFDTIGAAWQKLSQQFGFPNPWGSSGDTYSHPAPAPGADVAEQQNSGAQGLAASASAAGRIVINGEPLATWAGQVQLIGARPGVDGLYKIYQAEHMYSRQGFVTWLEVYPLAAQTGPDSISHGYLQPGGVLPNPGPNKG